MSTTWAHERWRKQYVREPLQHRGWTVIARGLREYLWKVAEEDGTLLRSARDPEELIAALNPAPSELELVREALRVLLTTGYLAWAAGRLWIPELTASQVWIAQGGKEPATLDKPEQARSPRTVAERVRASRARKKARENAAANEGVTAPPSVVSDERGGVTSSATTVTSDVTRDVSSSGDDCYTRPSQIQDQDQKDRSTSPSSPDLPVTTGVTRDVTLGVSKSPRNVTSSGRNDEKEDRSRRSPEAGFDESAPVALRAAAIVERPELARQAEPHKWPEVVAVASAFADAEGQVGPLLGPYEVDAGVRQIVALYASGATQPELEHVARTVPKESWWTSSPNRLGLESLSLAVVRRNRPRPLARTRPVSAVVAETLSWIHEQRRSAG